METREQIVGKLMSEDERLQYDGKDQERIARVSEKMTKSFVYLLGAVGNFRDESVRKADEDTKDRMSQARMGLIEAYANALVDVHKLGSTFRITGDAFDRMVDFLKGPEEAPLVMAGL